MSWWNEERDKALAECAAAGYSATQIAKAIGAVSRNAVIGRAGRIGVQLGAVPGPAKAGAASIAPKGRRKPWEPVIVPRAAKPKRLDPRRERWVHDEPILREMHAAGATAVRIAERLGRPAYQVTDKARDLGLKWARPSAKEASRGAPAEKPTPNWNRPSPAAERTAPTPLRTPVAVSRSEPVPFLDRRPGQCCWPLWEPPARTGLVCGVATGSVTASYCAAHQRQSMPREAVAA